MIDWSKAPEGTTHYYPEDAENLEHWMKVEGEHREICLAGRYAWEEDGDRDDPPLSAYIARPSAWTGEGLPPIGTVCEFLSLKDTWIQVRVISHLVEMQPACPAVVAQINETGPLCISQPKDFRPLRTPEQIAAEEREKAISDMPRVISSKVAESLYDLGYRKVDQA